MISVRTSGRRNDWPDIAAFLQRMANRLGMGSYWRHFLLMRTSLESHPQMRQVTVPLLENFQDRIPLLYYDIEPQARQIDNLRKPR